MAPKPRTKGSSQSDSIWRARRKREVKEVGATREAVCGPFPNAEELAAKIGVRENLLPLPPIPKPSQPDTQSGRVWTRFRKRLKVWRTAMRMVAALNALNHGECRRRSAADPNGVISDSLREAWHSSHAMLLAEAARIETGRRSLGLTGVQAVREITKATVNDRYSVKEQGTVSQVAMIASAIDEPTHDIVVPMLQALPRDEAEFYEFEANVLELAGTSYVYGYFLRSAGAIRFCGRHRGPIRAILQSLGLAAQYVGLQT